MRRTAVLAAAAAACLVAATAATAGTNAGLAGQTPVKAQQVGTDDLGDWGGGGDAAAVGHALGQDLLSASIGMPDAGTVEFVIGVSFLPSPGGAPEVSRYVWDFEVDKRFFELDGKFTNYSRGACDPTSGQCPPPRDPGLAPFLLRGDCVAGEGNVTTCKELGRTAARFDPQSRTITVPVPTTLLGAQPCSRITGGTNIFGGSVSASPAAFVSTSAAPLDTLDVLGTFRLPSADPAEPCA
ncbi:MAG TPA: hypothetical protein VM433_11485 [Mycobacteriales bacterium]|nr:hypothetical protein [Mycobacteriales bacterium]